MTNEQYAGVLVKGNPSVVGTQAPLTGGEHAPLRTEYTSVRGEPVAARSAVPRHPAISLLARYNAVFRAAWADRNELAGPKRMADEVAFLPAALSLQDTPVHPAPKRFAYGIMAFFMIALIWSFFGQIDIVAVAPGRVVVSERTKLIQPLERSVVERILVKDGDHVIAGQALVELDPTAASADKTNVDEQLKSSVIDVLRARTLLRALADKIQPRVASLPLATYPASWSESETSAAQAQLQAEWNDINAKLAKLGAEVNRRQAEIGTVKEVVTKLETTVPLARQREEDFRKLSEQGFVAGHAGQDRTRERIELERDLAMQKAKLVESQATLRESEDARSSFLAETRRNLFDREVQADLKRMAATQEQTKAIQRQKLTTLTAPVAGVVQQLAA
ncbi:MAG: biotin/lipoyl-binding protein, partial [Alphaproteobacteria bacterium]